MSFLLSGFLSKNYHWPLWSIVQALWLVLAGSLNTLLADLMAYKIGENELNL